ncbi:MAG TPA: hypothetical protein VF179_13525 [Thermoanaerobaculia bacterium]|nr:hypothetical protein [Thermoanaerobaculia bacterium]
MSRTLRLFLTGAMITLVAATGWSAPRTQNKNQASRIWALNVGQETVEVKIERSRSGISASEMLAVSPGEIVEVKRMADEDIGIPEHRDLVVVTTPAAFDPTAALKVDTAIGLAGRRDGLRVRTEEVSAEKTERHVVLERGEVASSIFTGTEVEPRTVRLRLQGTKSWAEVRLKGLDGAMLGYVTFSASRPVNVTLDFGRLLQERRHWGSVRREVLVHAGKVSVMNLAAEKNPGSIKKATAALSNGTGYFNYTRNWELTPDLRYYVEGGPASTCGELNINRNGTWHFGQNWLCTNSTGYAEKGPWSWANQSGDETAEAFIRWPDQSATSSDWHYWDKTCPSVGIRTVNNPSLGLYPPPIAWGGNADDPQYGACFGDGWSRVYATFQETNPATSAVRYWTEDASDYFSFSPSETEGELTGMPTCGAEWTTPFPPDTAHTSGFHYRWTVCVVESPLSNCEPCTSYEFTY